MKCNNSIKMWANGCRLINKIAEWAAFLSFFQEILVWHRKPSERYKNQCQYIWQCHYQKTDEGSPKRLAGTYMVSLSPHSVSNKNRSWKRTKQWQNLPISYFSLRHSATKAQNFYASILPSSYVSHFPSSCHNRIDEPFKQAMIHLEWRNGTLRFV